MLTDVHLTCHPSPLTYGDLGSGTEEIKGKVSRDKNWGDQGRQANPRPSRSMEVGAGKQGQSSSTGQD